MHNIMRFIQNKRGDTNFVSIIILLGVIIAAVTVFRPYIAQLFGWVAGLFS